VQEVNSSYSGAPGVRKVYEPRRASASISATISACSTALRRRSTQFTPTASGRGAPRAKIAAPKGPPLPRSTFSRASVIARRMRPISFVHAGNPSTTPGTHSGSVTATAVAIPDEG
jgi:hypothetical protein